MKRFVDLDSQFLLGAADAWSPLINLGKFKRGNILTLDIQFVSAGVVQEFADSATGLIGFKPKGNHNATSYCANGTWTKSGSGAATIYSFAITFINPVMDALFAIGTPAAASEIAAIDLIGEIKWTVAVHEVNRPFKTQRDFALQVVNDINQGGESSTSYPATAVAVVLPNISRLTGGVLATDLDAQALAGYPDLTCFDVVVDIGGGTFSGSRWQKRAGNHASDIVAGYILCLDGTQLIRVGGY